MPLTEMADRPDRLTDAHRLVDVPHLCHPEGADADSRFHALLANGCGNPMLAALIDRLHDQTRLAPARLAETPEHRRCEHDELGQVLHAVRTANPDAAETAMRAHIRRTRAALDAIDEGERDHPPRYSRGG